MPNAPRLLLLGDSIRMSYQPHVAQLLDGKVEVTGPAENCQFSLYTLSSLNRWIDELGQPEIVHWNNGIHDAGHNPATALSSPCSLPSGLGPLADVGCGSGRPTDVRATSHHRQCRQARRTPPGGPTPGSPC